MTKLEQIEESVAALSDEELRQFAVWFADCSGHGGTASSKKT